MPLKLPAKTTRGSTKGGIFKRTSGGSSAYVYRKEKKGLKRVVKKKREKKPGKGDTPRGNQRWKGGKKNP